MAPTPTAGLDGDGDPPKLVFPLNATKSVLQECEGIGKVQSAAVELIGRGAAALLQMVLDEMGGELTVDRLRQVIDEDDSFECLRGAVQKVEALEAAASNATSANATLPNGSGKHPTSRKRAATTGRTNAKKRHAPKRTLEEAKAIAEQDKLVAAEHLHPDTKIVPDEEDYD